MRTPVGRRVAAAILSVSAVLAVGGCNDAGPAPADDDQPGQQQQEQQDGDGGADEGDDDNGNLTGEDGGDGDG